MKNYVYFIVLTCIITLSNNRVNGQASSLSHQRNPNWYLGWDGTGINQGSLEIRNDFTEPINFSTGGTPRATILANGNFGIGLPIPPTYLLDVNGTININDPLTGFHIGGNELLKYHGNPGYQTSSTTNIFVGLDAGLNKNSL